MTVQEAYNEWFVKPMSDYIKTNPQELIDYLQEHQEEVTIIERDVEIEDVKKRAQDPTYLTSPIEITEEGIIFNGINQDVVDFVIKHVPKTVKKIKLPNTFLDNTAFLEKLPNLNTLSIQGYCKFNEEELRHLQEKTNITRIESKNAAIVPHNYVPKKNELYLKAPSEVFISGKIINVAGPNSFARKAVEAVVSGTSIDLNLLEQAYNLCHKPDKKIESVEIKSYALADKNGYPQDLLKMTINQQGEIEELIYDGTDDMTKLTKLVQQLEKKYTIKKIILKCQNKSYDNLYYLNSIAKKYDLEIDYGTYQRCNLEEFQAMRETLDWFNELVRQENLSPAEIVTYAYDIMKTFAYKENEEDKSIPRKLHSIIMSDYIVCVGYARFMEQILTENGIKAEEIGVTCNVGTKHEGGHARTLVRIDDDKYNIHGVFCVDATWDRQREALFKVETEEGKNYIQYGINPGDKKEKDYDPMGLYRNFLVNAYDYPRIYPQDTMPSVFRRTLDNTMDELKEEKNFLDKDYSAFGTIKKLFTEEETIDDVKDYMRTKRPSLETIRQILFNVRKAQGYTTESALETVEDNIELNQMIDEFNRKEKTFFQSSQNRK